MSATRHSALNGYRYLALVTAVLVTLVGCATSPAAVPSQVAANGQSSPPPPTEVPSADCANPEDILELARCLDAALPPVTEVIGGGAGAPEPTPVYDPDAPIIEGLSPNGVTPSTPNQAEVKQYLSVVLNYIADMWRERFARAGYTGSDDLLIYFIEQGSTYTTSCTDQYGKSLPPITYDYNNVFYCWVDKGTLDGVSYAGSLVVPLGTLGKVWTGDVVGHRAQVIGDFGAALILAHEFGHHIADTLNQYVPGDKPSGLRSSELLADCFAGVWAGYANHYKLLEPGDLAEGISAFEAVGHGGPSTADTYGTPAERANAVNDGYLGYFTNDFRFQAGSMEGCVAKYWNYVP